MKKKSKSKPKPEFTQDAVDILGLLFLGLIIGGVVASMIGYQCGYSSGFDDGWKRHRLETGRIINDCYSSTPNRKLSYTECLVDKVWKQK